MSNTKNLLKKIIKVLHTPTGITLEWWSGGFRFAPPLYAWLVLEVVLAIAVVVLYL